MSSIRNGCMVLGIDVDNMVDSTFDDSGSARLWSSHDSWRKREESFLRRVSLLVLSLNNEIH